MCALLAQCKSAMAAGSPHCGQDCPNFFRSARAEWVRAIAAPGTIVFLIFIKEDELPADLCLLYSVHCGTDGRRRMTMHGVLAKIIGAAALFTVMTAPAFAAEYEVHMLNKGEAGAMVFEPAFLHVAPGDTV